MAEIKIATDANFEELVLKSERPVVVDFWAAWCGPCKMVAPEMEKLAEKYDGTVDVVKVDVDANPMLSQAFNILSIPVIAFFKPGSQPQGVVGYLRVCASDDMVAGMLDRLPVSAEPERLRYAAVGRALADPKRLCVLESLALGELSVTDLSERVGCQVPNMSQHLAVLRSAGLVTTRRDGSTIFYRLADPRVLEAYRLIQDIAG